MSNLIQNLFNLCIVPFKNNDLFVVVAGILACSWLIRHVYMLIRNDYS